MNVRIMKCSILLNTFSFSIENARESYFRYDGSSTQEGHRCGGERGEDQSLEEGNQITA